MRIQRGEPGAQISVGKYRCSLKAGFEWVVHGCCVGLGAGGLQGKVRFVKVEHHDVNVLELLFLCISRIKKHCMLRSLVRFRHLHRVRERR